MAPSAPATARRAPTASRSQSGSASRRPELSVLERGRLRHRTRTRSLPAPVWVAAGVVVASLLAVVAGDTVVTQNQVRLANIQLGIDSAQATQKTMQTGVADLAAPDNVVREALNDGMVAKGTVLNLPYVPLNTPLPAPQTGNTPATNAAATTAR